MIPKDPRALLIVRLGALGDVLHAWPVLRYLRAKLPDAKIGWVVERAGEPLVEGLPGLDATRMMDRAAWKKLGKMATFNNMRRFAKSLKDEGWDTTIDLQGLARSGIVSWALGAKRRVGFGGNNSRELNSWWMTERHTPPASLPHVIDQNLFLAASMLRDGALLGVAHDVRLWQEATSPWTSPPPPLPSVAEKSPLDAVPAILLNPGAAWESKRWPVERFGLLARVLAARVPEVKLAVTLGPGEDDWGTTIRDVAMSEDIALPTPPVPRERWIELPVLRWPAMIAWSRVARLFVSGDTGPLHLAAAFGVPCVALYGGSDPARNGPHPAQSPVSIVVDAHEGEQGPRRHYRHDPIGLKNVSVDRVADACRRLLDGV